MFVPKNIGLLRPPVRIEAFDSRNRLLPVMRHEDHDAIHFFYFAEGCSDTHIKANKSNALVAHDRIDAVRRLAGARAPTLLKEWCAHTIEEAAVRKLPSMLLPHSPTSELSAIKSFVTGSGCLNQPLYGLMTDHGLDTLVLNYEAPGASYEQGIKLRKIEIIYRGSDFYDSHGIRCQLIAPRGCYQCAGSVLSRAACDGTLNSLSAQEGLVAREH